MKFIPPLIVFILSAFTLSLHAQTLRADFTVDKAGGCSPLNVSFTNITSGASTNATYQWDLGNGNTSILKNTGAVYYEEKAYTVTLTVKDGTQTSTLSRTVTVYKKPVPDFSFTPNNGCIPLLVSFNASAAPGDGSIAAWHWDYGDGATQQVFNSATSHIYNFEQTASVSLTAVSNYGCAGSVTKNNIITAKAHLQAGFNANQTILCNAPGTVTFNNTCSGPGTLTYTWDFGDGGSSTEKDPVYTYTRRGIYTVKVTVTSSEGCTDVMTRASYINIADFKTDFSVPATVLCTNTSINLENLSSPVPTQSLWNIDNLVSYINYNNAPFNYYAQDEGTHTITLTNNFGPCTQTTTKQVEIKKSISLNGFIAEVIDPCFSSGVQVHFKDTATGSVEWYWESSLSGNLSWKNDKQELTYAYPVDGVYNVLLRVRNADGCVSSVSKYVSVSRPLVGVWMDPGYTNEACGSLRAKFNARSTESISSYSWNFGDGGTSTDANPEHFFDKPGTYKVSLTYVTEHGCRATVFYDSYIFVRQKPAANFSVQPTVCGNTPVVFNNLSTGFANSYSWDYGDNTGSLVPMNIHQYYQEGDFTVRLIAFNGMCNDTIIKPAVIKVSPPFAKIIAAANTCGGNRGAVTFTDGSTQADSWKWDFGDGATTSYNVADARPPTFIHNYAQSGKYKVVLSVTNGSCTVKDSTTVYVLLKQQPILSFDKREPCLNTTFQYQVTGLVASQHPPLSSPANYYFARWEMEDASSFPGFYDYSTTWQSNVTGPMRPYELKEGQVRAIVGSYYFNCYDTTNFVPFKVKGVNAGYEVLTDQVCFKSPIIFRDTTKTVAGDPIVSWQWDFGDNTTQTVSHGGLIEHTYTNPGQYFVTLRVTDAGGCTSNSSHSRYVSTSGPKVAFNPSPGTNVQLNTTVTFYNYSNTFNSYNTTWKWDFGNGITSTDYTPTCTYTVPGEYIVRLIGENPLTGCKDTVKQTITVRNFNSGFSQTASFVGDYGKCPPVVARFTNTSSNYTRVVWDFGDGFKLENQNNPSHIYTNPGKYEVTLFVYGFNGLTGTYKDSIFVTRPQASIQANDLDGCIGQSFLLNAPVHTNSISYLWDFGNGQIINSPDSFATHAFTAAGTYTPSLLVKDKNGCQAAITSPDKIVINPAPTITLGPAAPLVCKTAPVQLTATSGAVRYEWSPATGLSAPDIPSPVAFPATNTLYTVKAWDAIGCVGENTITVNVATTIDMTAITAANVCKGGSVQLQANGADSYLWINTTTGLNDPRIPNPFAKPDMNTTYTIVGYDKYKCYSDTATVTVTVRAMPVVDAGADRETIFGMENVLSVTNSPDVVRWNWTPAEFLNCTSCAAPVSRPYKSMDYIVTVYNEYDCAAKDTLHINAICTGAKIFIPNSFSPNHDGKNEVFGIAGSGVRVVKSFRIYNRWGEIVFEKKNFYPNDISGSWNGRNKGVEVDTGIYVYFAELECDANETFERKGTVLLVR